MNENNYNHNNQNHTDDMIHDTDISHTTDESFSGLDSYPPETDSYEEKPYGTEPESFDPWDHDTDLHSHDADFSESVHYSDDGEAEVDYNVAKGSSMVFDSGRSYNTDYNEDYEPDHYTDQNAYNDGYDSGSVNADYDSFNPQHDYSGSYGNAPETDSDSRQQYGSYYTSAPHVRTTRKSAKQKKKSSSLFGRILASLIVIALCGMAGFGGATLAYRNTTQNSHQTTSNVNITGDVTSANAASVIAEKVMPSVVGISTIAQSQRETIFGLQSGTVQGIGTGIIVSEDGYILTNSHVVNDGDTQQITVDLYDGTEYNGNVLWNDSSLDLAIVKIDAKGLSAAEIGNSDEVNIGDYALAIGNPLGLNYERSVTSGIISGLNRSITTQDESTGKTNKMDGLIQTDAAINSGNSGGPLINSSGQVIGINTAKASSSEGLGFAIPINSATPIIKQIKEKGSYEQTYIGISGVDLTTIATNYATDFKADNGVFVMQIYTESPAAAAGLKEGDIITEIDGKAVDGMSSLKSTLINYSPGDTVELTIERDKSNQKVSLTLGSSADATTSLQGTQGNSSQGSGSYGGSGYGGSGYGGFGGLFGQ